MLSMPLLLALFSPSDAVLLSSIMGVAATPQMAWMYRRHSSFRDIAYLVIGCIPGCMLGGIVLKLAPMHVLQLLICAMLFCFVGLQCVRRVAAWKLPEGRAIDILAGVACGFASTSMSMSGVPLSIYVLLRHWEPDRARGNMSLFYVFTVGGAVLTQAGAGLYRLELFKLAAAGIAGTAAGQYLGYLLGRHVDQVLFRRIVIAFLGVAACVLMWRALS